MDGELHGFGDLRARLSEAVRTALQVLSDPRGFFSEMPREGGFEEPLLFAGIALAATALVRALLSLAGLSFGGFLAALILTPVFAALGLAVGAFVLLLLSRALGGEASFESSLRIVAYAGAILPIQAVSQAVPYAHLLASAYGMYIAIVAVIAVHRVPEAKAWGVLGGLAGALLLFGLFAEIAARRVAPAMQTWGTHLEKSSEEMGRAMEKWAEEMERARKKMEGESGQ